MRHVTTASNNQDRRNVTYLIQQAAGRQAKPEAHTARWNGASFELIYTSALTIESCKHRHKLETDIPAHHRGSRARHVSVPWRTR
ncbi:MAG: hypothetical protein ACI8WM_003449 [Burkholderiaceae bacterium]|jgi:hypothetical protein